MRRPETIHLQPEILAPVGNADMLRAAVYAGADAVYLGLLHFNARSTAGNFGAEELAEACAFCRQRGVRVYVTLNTTLYPGELAELEQSIRDAADAGADALIVQDLAVARMARAVAPGLALHASTQMSVHSLAGAKQLAQMGFSRVILARELTLAEMRDISRGCGIETEAFIHGALCMSVSGQCYLSAFLGGRSGNRGACAGPCRLPFSAGEPGACHLSLRDMSHIPQLAEMAQAGIASVKIEGRLRSPEYVAAAVDACVRARAGQPYDAQTLQDVFSRSGFTNGYITGRRDGAMFGVRTGEDAAAAKRAAPRLHELYRRERAAVPVSMELTLAADGARLAAVDADGNTAEAHRACETQPARGELAAGYERSLGKTGGTPFYLAQLTFPAGAGLYVPAGEINELRRAVLDELLAARGAARGLRCTQWHEGPAPAPRTAGGARLILRFDSPAQMPQALPERAQRIVLPLSFWREVPESMRPKVWLELPRALFGAAEQEAQKQIALSAEAGFGGYTVSNPAHVGLLAGLPAMGDFGLNVTNHHAAEGWAEMGLSLLTASPELTLEDMARLGSPVPVTALAYGHMPLMLTRACPLHNVHTCAGCVQKGELTDRKGMHFPVRCTGPAGVRTVYNPVPIYMGDKAAQFPTDWLTLYFTVEPRGEAERVLALFCAGEPFPEAFTRGLYYRGTN